MSEQRKYAVEMPATYRAVGAELDDVETVCIASEVEAMRDKYEAILEEIDLKAEAGLCQFSSGGKHAFLQDIRSVRRNP